MFDRLIKAWRETGDDYNISAIFNDIAFYWKATDNFLMAHQRYLEDLDFRFELLFTAEQILTIAAMLSQTSVHLEYGNAMYISSQFVYYHIFGGHKPNRKRNSNEYIFNKLDNLDKLLVQPTPPCVNKKYRLILSNKNYNSL